MNRRPPRPTCSRRLMLLFAVLATVAPAAAAPPAGLGFGGGDPFGSIRAMLPSGTLGDPRGDVGAGQGGPAVERLRRVEQHMQAAETTLAADDFRGGASAAQLEALSELDLLVTRLQGECQRLAEQRRPPTPAQRKPADSQANAAATPGDSPETSSARPTAPPIDRAAISRLVTDRWGQLPQRQRDVLLQPLSDRFMPKYAADIEEYFRALAEPSDAGAGGQP